MDLMESRPRGGNLSWRQIDGLMEVLHYAFIMLRSPPYHHRRDSIYGLAELRRIRDRSVAFAEALHNLPPLMFTGRLDLEWLQRSMEFYARPRSHDGWEPPLTTPYGGLLDLAMRVREVMEMGQEE